MAVQLERMGWNNNSKPAINDIGLKQMENNIQNAITELENNTQENITSAEENIQETISKLENRVIELENKNIELEKLINATVLYENDEGSADSITLTDSIENYSELEIQSYVIYAGQKVFINTGKIPVSSAGRIHLNNMFLSTTGIQWYNKRISISGNTLSPVSDRFNNNNSISDGTYTYITKLIGYK